jgi:hypothetical protein
MWVVTLASISANLCAVADEGFTKVARFGGEQRVKRKTADVQRERDHCPRKLKM